MDSLVPITTHSYLIWQSAFSSVYINTLVFLITDQVPNNHPGHQNQDLDEQWPYSLSSLEGNKKLDM